MSEQETVAATNGIAAFQEAWRKLAPLNSVPVNLKVKSEDGANSATISRNGQAGSLTLTVVTPELTSPEITGPEESGEWSQDDLVWLTIIEQLLSKGTTVGTHSFEGAPILHKLTALMDKARVPDVPIVSGSAGDKADGVEIIEPAEEPSPPPGSSGISLKDLEPDDEDSGGEQAEAAEAEAPAEKAVPKQLAEAPQADGGGSPPLPQRPKSNGITSPVVSHGAPPKPAPAPSSGDVTQYETVEEWWPNKKLTDRAIPLYLRDKYPEGTTFVIESSRATTTYKIGERGTWSTVSTQKK